jgi:hypothetical protein
MRHHDMAQRLESESFHNISVPDRRKNKDPRSAACGFDNNAIHNHRCDNIHILLEYS